MPRELSIDHFRTAPSTNCAVSVFCAAIDNISTRSALDPNWIKRAIPFTNEVFLTKLLKMLEIQRLGDFPVEMICIPYNRENFFDAIIDTLYGGALCYINVWSQRWLNNYRKVTTPIEPEGQHAILIYGHYQPTQKCDKTWFYTYDPYDNKLLFIKADDIFSNQVYYRDETDRSKVLYYVTMIGLCQDHASLTRRFQPARNFVANIDEKEILERLPGISAEAKLGMLIAPKRSASRRRS